MLPSSKHSDSISTQSENSPWVKKKNQIETETQNNYKEKNPSLNNWRRKMDCEEKSWLKIDDDYNQCARAYQKQQQQKNCATA